MLGAKASVLPLFIRGTVVKGFGRGSKELGCPTANFPETVVDKLPKDLPNGIYFGLAQVDNGPVYKMVLSLGWNPFYGNTKKSFETHIIHNFENDFYDSELIVVMLGYLRPEKNFDSLDALKEAIWADVEDAKRELEKEEFLPFYQNDIFINPNNNS
jgi:riboflavin kinase